MADSKINGLVALTDAQVNDNTKLLPFAIASTGVAYQGTIGQLKLAVSTQKVKYVATGAEGTTITIGVLAAQYILMIAREGMILYEVASAPASAEFIWNSTSIILGTAANPGERFLILYKNA